MSVIPNIVTDQIFSEMNSTFNTSTIVNNRTNISCEKLVLDDPGFKIVNLVILEILSPIVIIFGVLGNIMNIIVLTRRSMYSSTNCYLTTLAIYDLCYLIVVSTNYVIQWKVFKDLLPDGYYEYIVYARPIADIFSNTGVWLTVVFTVERYIAVCHPMKGRVLCTPKRARWVILVTCLIVFLVLIPEFFENEVNCATSIEPTAFAKQPGYNIGYNWGIVLLLFAIIPLILVSIFNMFLVKSVWKASQARIQLGNTNEARKNKDQQKITLMLIAVVVAFFCLHMPNAVALFYYSYKNTFIQSVPDHCNHTEKIQLYKLFTFVNFFALINSAINFVLYSSLSTKFRKNFKRIFVPYCLNPNDRHFSIRSIWQKTGGTMTDTMKRNDNSEEHTRIRLVGSPETNTKISDDSKESQDTQEMADLLSTV